MNYKAYPKEADTPSRKTRKSVRNTTFMYNYTLKRKQLRKMRKEREEN